MRKQIDTKNLILGVIILLLVLVVIYSGLQILKPTVFSNGDTTTSSKTIIRDGVKYFPRQDISIFLIMGIDETGPVKDSGSYNNEGEADMVMLAIFDETAKTYDVLCLNRDTMLEMQVLGLGGKPAGTTVAQLAISHSFGSGLEDSCENTRNAVSDFLYGIPIDYYLSLNMDAIGILNDAVGGVKVTVTDDFSEIDPTITKGEVVLNAEQALKFVQTRKGLGDQMNLSRMDRHKEYAKGFLSALRAKLEGSDSFVLHAYNDVKDYMVTDCSFDTLTSLVSRYADYELDEIVTPAGENVAGERYMEYHVDEELLDELILRLFYAKK